MNIIIVLVMVLAVNVTISIQEDELTYCYWNGHERTPTCNYTEIDKDRFMLIDRFMQFLAQGDLLEEED